MSSKRFPTICPKVVSLSVGYSVIIIDKHLTSVGLDQAVTVLDRSDNTDVFKVDLTKFRGKFRASACAVKYFKSQSFSGESECKVYQDLMKRNQLEGGIQ